MRALLGRIVWWAIGERVERACEAVGARALADLRATASWLSCSDGLLKERIDALEARPAAAGGVMAPSPEAVS